MNLTKRNVLFPLRNRVAGDKPLSVEAGGQTFLLAPEGAVPYSVWSERPYEGKFEVEFILSVLQAGMTFVDVGANVGLFSIPAAKKLQSHNLFAFEPCHWTYQQLLQNARINKVENLRAVHAAVGDRVGEAVLQVNAAGKDGLNTIGKPTHRDSEIVGTETVPMTTLDDFARQNGISQVDVMKIDTEGAERLVLRGARRLLAKPNAPLILYEGGVLSQGFGYHPVESMWLLQKYGYSLFVINQTNGQISVPANSHAYDAMVIAVKPSHPAYAKVKELAR